MNMASRLIIGTHHLSFASTWFLMGSVLLIFLVFCVVFVLFVCVMCLVCSMLPVSLDCPFLIAPSVFSNVMGICWWVPCIMSDTGEVLFYEAAICHPNSCCALFWYFWNHVVTCWDLYIWFVSFVLFQTKSVQNNIIYSPITPKEQ